MINMRTRTKEDQARAIILGYASACSIVSGILANTVAGDIPFLAVLNAAMIIQLADLCGKSLTIAAATATATQLFAVVAGGYLAAKLFTWFPVFGNIINASIAFGLAQVIGWTAFAMYDQGISQEEAIKFARTKEISQEEMNKIINKMSAYDKAKYDRLKSRLSNPSISDVERQNIASEMAELIGRYQ